MTETNEENAKNLIFKLPKLNKKLIETVPIDNTLEQNLKSYPNLSDPSELPIIAKNLRQQTTNIEKEQKPNDLTPKLPELPKPKNKRDGMGI